MDHYRQLLYVGDVMTRLVTCLRPTGSKKRRQANAEKTLKKKKTKKEDSDTCLYCTELNSKTRKGHSWMDCGACGQWAPSVCAG